MDRVAGARPPALDRRSLGRPTAGVEDRGVGSVLVTGGAGFLGRHLVERLAGSGEQVVSYNRDHVESPGEAVIAVQGELYDIGRLVRVCRDHAVDRIVHTAAMSHPAVSFEMPVATFAANVEGTLHVLESARLAGVARIVNFSSEAVFGDNPGPIAEDTEHRPDSPYAVSKVTGELLAGVYNRHYGLDVISLRPTELYGPGNRMPSIIHDIVRAAVDRRPLRVDAGGEHSFDLVHVRDVAVAAQLALRVGPRRRDAFNISGGGRTSLRAVATLVAEIAGGADLRLGPGQAPGFYRQGPWNGEVAAAELGYRPQWDLRRGLADYADWLREHPY
jgi:nucleoside-diphosphate-sugar epimerase